MTARETLELCRSFAIETAALARLVELAEQRIPLAPGGCRPIALADMPRGGGDVEAAAIAHADGMEQWYLRYRAELVVLVEQAEQLIGGLETWAKVIVRAYYIEGKTDTEVAAIMGWTRRATACDKRMEILEEIDKNA